MSGANKTNLLPFAKAVGKILKETTDAWRPPTQELTTRYGEHGEYLGCEAWVTTPGVEEVQNALSA